MIKVVTKTIVRGKCQMVKMVTKTLVRVCPTHHDGGRAIPQFGGLAEDDSTLHKNYALV